MEDVEVRRSARLRRTRKLKEEEEQEEKGEEEDKYEAVEAKRPRREISQRELKLIELIEEKKKHVEEMQIARRAREETLKEEEELEAAERAVLARLNEETKLRKKYMAGLDKELHNFESMKNRLEKLSDLRTQLMEIGQSRVQRWQAHMDYLLPQTARVITEELKERRENRRLREELRKLREDIEIIRNGRDHPFLEKLLQMTEEDYD